MKDYDRIEVLRSVSVLISHGLMTYNDGATIINAFTEREDEKAAAQLMYDSAYRDDVVIDPGEALTRVMLGQAEEPASQQ